MEKISYIIFAVTIILLAGAAIFIFLYFDTREYNEEKKGNNSFNEWNWKPAAYRIKTKWAFTLDQNKV